MQQNLFRGVGELLYKVNLTRFRRQLRQGCGDSGQLHHRGQGAADRSIVGGAQRLDAVDQPLVADLVRFYWHAQPPLGTANHVQRSKIQRRLVVLDAFCMAVGVSVDRQRVRTVIAQQALQRVAQRHLQLRIGGQAGEVPVELGHALVERAYLLLGIAGYQFVCTLRGIVGYRQPEYRCRRCDSG